MSKQNEMKEKIVDEIIRKIETIPNLTWNRMLNVEMPRNLEGRFYNGANILNLNLSTIGTEYKTNLWGTFKQVSDLGGQVKKGEKATTVLFYKMIQEKDRLTGEPTGLMIPMLKEYKVFNISQTTLELEKLKIEPIIKEEPEKIIEGYKKNSGVAIKTSLEGKAYYSLALDHIVTPPKEHYQTIDKYYSTVFHEITHSTGNKKRLDRDMSGTFGNEKYAKEELVAELGAAFLLNKCGIENSDVEKNNAAYIKGWLKPLKEDKNLLFDAAKHAMKAHDYIIDISQVQLEKTVEKEKKCNFKEFVIEPIESINGQKMSMLINDYVLINKDINREELIQEIGKENIIKAATYSPAILEEFKSLQNREVISEIMKQPNADIPGIMFFAGQEVQSDKDFIRELMKDKNIDIAMLINSASLEIQYDKEFKPYIDDLEKYCKAENIREKISNKIIENFPNIKYKLYNDLQDGKNIFVTTNDRSIPNSFVDPNDFYKIGINPKDESYFDFKIEKLDDLLIKHDLNYKNIQNFLSENGTEKTWIALEQTYPEITRQYSPYEIVKYCIEHNIMLDIKNLEVKSKKIEFENEETGKKIYVEMIENDGKKEVRASQSSEPFNQEPDNYIKYGSIIDAAAELIKNGFVAKKEENKIILSQDYTVAEIFRDNTKLVIDNINKEAKEIKKLDISFNQDLKERIKLLQPEKQKQEIEIQR